MIIRNTDINYIARNLCLSDILVKRILGCCNNIADIFKIDLGMTNDKLESSLKHSLVSILLKLNSERKN